MSQSGRVCARRIVIDPHSMGRFYPHGVRACDHAKTEELTEQLYYQSQLPHNILKAECRLKEWWSHLEALFIASRSVPLIPGTTIVVPWPRTITDAMTGASDPLSSPHLAPEGCQLDEPVLDCLLSVHPFSVKRCQYVAPAVTMLRCSPQCLSAYCLPGGQLNCTGKHLPTRKESSGLHLRRLGGAPCGSVRRNSWGATPASILKKLDLPTGHQQS